MADVDINDRNLTIIVDDKTGRRRIGDVLEIWGEIEGYLSPTSPATLINVAFPTDLGVFAAPPVVACGIRDELAVGGISAVVSAVSASDMDLYCETLTTIGNFRGVVYRVIGLIA
jgi:hypothetical protein